MGGSGELFRWIQSSDTTMVNNNNFIDFKSTIISTSGFAETIYFPMNYWGSTDMEKIKKMVKDGLPEDNGKTTETQIQKATDEHIEKVDKILLAKEKEIMAI